MLKRSMAALVVKASESLLRSIGNEWVSSKSLANTLSIIRTFFASTNKKAALP